MGDSTYRGRFAPSPTGPLHLGSLLTAVASYLEAKVNSGTWLVRMEDLDPPREIPGAADDILRTLEQFGFEWDEPVLYQSQQNDTYLTVLKQLQQQALTFPCDCSRKTLQSTAKRGPEGPLYPGTCRHKHHLEPPFTTRIKAADKTVSFTDQVQGLYQQNIQREVGDFIVRRRDQYIAYQLAVVVDDQIQNITHIVRGSDLLSSTPRQCYLQSTLHYSTPNYAHLPVLTNAQGNKLSKQSHAKAIVSKHAKQHLFHTLTLLGQSPPEDLITYSVSDIWLWAKQHWQLALIPKQLAIDLSDNPKNAIYY